MALNSRQKRAAVVGTARIWYRNPHPSGVDAAQRASIGSVYPVATFAGAALTTVMDFGRGLMRGMFRGVSR